MGKQIHARRTRRSSLLIAFFTVFLVGSIVTAIYANNILRIPFDIRKCDPSGYAKDRFMVRCGAVDVANFNAGALFLGSHRDAIAGLKRADVVIMGNSRTQRSFSVRLSNPILSRRDCTISFLLPKAPGFASARTF